LAGKATIIPSGFLVRRGTHGTGLGLRNASQEKEAAVSAFVYGDTGGLIATENLTIPARGQRAFVFGKKTDQKGWIHVVSDQKLTGVCFIATADADNFMADIPLIYRLSASLQIPHVAQNDHWDTMVYLCNPNAGPAAVTLRFVSPEGSVLHSQQVTVLAVGSSRVALQEMVQGNQYGEGSLEISSDKEIGAFALYENLKTGNFCYAGVAAMDPADQ
jgi:hypothetical protein